MKKIGTAVAALVLALVALVAVPTAANAATSTLTFTGFAPNTAVTISVDAPVSVTIEAGSSDNTYPAAIIRPAVISSATLRSDASGTVSVRVITPDSFSGSISVSVSGTGADGQPLTKSQTTTVQAVSGGGSGALPPTGVDAASMAGIWIGGGVLLLGGLVVTVVAARRKSAAQQH